MHCAHSGIALSLSKEILTPATTWAKLEDAVLREQNTLDTGQVLHDPSHTRSLELTHSHEKWEPAAGAT